MIIAGKQINLRDLTLDDLPAWAYWQGAEHAWYKTDGPYYPPPTFEAVEKSVETLYERIQAGNWPEPRTRLAISRQGSEELLGMVNRYWQSQETNWLSVGITIYDPAFWGQGIGFEGLGLWMDYLFRTMPELVRLDLRTWSGNIGMIHLAEKLGYQQEACFRQARIVAGQYFDGLGYGILKSEWLTQWPDGFRLAHPGRLPD